MVCKSTRVDIEARKMKECIITVGVSGSGKTTWAEKKIIESQDENWVNLNRDDIRTKCFTRLTGCEEFAWSQWIKEWETLATKEWKEALIQLSQRTDLDGVIISDTNLHSKTREFVYNLFESSGWHVIYKFFDITFGEAVKRDLKRKNPVGSSVIASQIENYWKQFGEKYHPNTELPKAVIIDIDGTLAHNEGIRDIYDYKRVSLDQPDDFVVEVAKGLNAQGIAVVIVSGRDDSCRDETEKWLLKFLEFKPTSLHMRSTGDGRKDYVVKRDIFFRNIAPVYNVIGVIEDRPQVIMNLWKPIGIKTLICGNPYKFF